eukprot:CFRG1169T1
MGDQTGRVAKSITNSTSVSLGQSPSDCSIGSEGRFHRPPTDNDPRQNLRMLNRTESLSDDIWQGIKFLHKHLRGERVNSIKEEINFSIPCTYRWNLSTEENYCLRETTDTCRMLHPQDCKDCKFYAEIQNLPKKQQLEILYPNDCLRRSIDYNYHKHYQGKRRILQNNIVSALTVSVVEDMETPGLYCERPEAQWLIFTAGPMGAGKTHVLKWMWTEGYFPLHSFVHVNSDRIRTMLPEYTGYVTRDQPSAGDNTNKEAGFIAELLLGAAMLDGRNVIVDGSLKSWEWHKSIIKQLRIRYGESLQIGIIYIWASEKMVKQRALEREKKTGRHIPSATLLSAIDKVPVSVEHLRESVDVVFSIMNDENGKPPKLVSGGDWNQFSNRFAQACAWTPKNNI